MNFLRWKRKKSLFLTAEDAERQGEWGRGLIKALPQRIRHNAVRVAVSYENRLFAARAVSAAAHGNRLGRQAPWLLRQ
jgi:hypothetical protein